MKNSAPQVTVALIQSKCSDDPCENLQRAIQKVRQAAHKGAQIVCLQELFRTRYFCQVHDPAAFDNAETIPGESTRSFTALAKELDVVIIVPLFEKRAAGLYHNTAVVIDAGGTMLGTFRKMHIPHDPLYYEKYYFSPGDQGYKAFDTKYGKIGILICWDQWFPEAARLTALQGAQIIFYPTAIGWHPAERREFGPAQRDAWLTIQRAHAIANGLFVASCNRIGLEKSRNGQLQFWGTSFVCDPFGRILAHAPVNRQQNVIATCDLALLERTRRNWPFLRDRRVDSYQPITRMFGDPP